MLGHFPAYTTSVVLQIALRIKLKFLTVVWKALSD